ncbi:MAG: hypothetical protein ACE141_03730 [Bryobacteraceae bacterium]
MDAVYLRVSSERQTTENQFEDLLQVAERDGSARDWAEIRRMLSACVVEEQLATSNGTPRKVYRVQPEVVARLADHCIHVEQGKSGKTGAGRRSRVSPGWEGGGSDRRAG